MWNDESGLQKYLQLIYLRVFNVFEFVIEQLNSFAKHININYPQKHTLSNNTNSDSDFGAKSIMHLPTII